MISSTLNIKANSDNARIFYEDHSTYHEGDAGVDLFFITDVDFPPQETIFVDFNISCNMVEKREGGEYSVNYYLYPRSSISKTPLMMANSVGIIDSTYRGPIIAAVRNISTEKYSVKRGQRLFQICSRTLEPFMVRLVEDLPKTTRNSGGFGSTGL